MQTREHPTGVDRIPLTKPPPAAPLAPLPAPSTVAPPAVAPPAARPPRSVLGRLTASAALLAVGVLAMVDLAGARIPGSAYAAVPLAVVGAGLLVGAWYGRARALIAFGAVLLAALVAVTAAEGVDRATSGSVTWKPTSVEQIGPSYRIGMGNAVLDLSAVDFAGRSVAVTVHVSMGNLTVVVPSTVDVTVRANVDVGNSTVFGERWSGIDQPERSAVDYGRDGPGGGDLTIRATVDVGDLEVRR